LPLKQWYPFVRLGIRFADQTLTLGELFDPNSMKFGDQVWLAGLGVDDQVAQK
jgi:hypothetical protein